MKVGTDAILLGAWCDVANCKYALDVGTGTGILALMIAQRNHSLLIDAIDIEESAIAQARTNFSNSDFANRISAYTIDFKVENRHELLKGKSFDLIISNPPFYKEEVFCPDDYRNNARHTNSLPFATLIKRTSVLLAPDGLFSVIIPYDSAGEFIETCESYNLFLSRRTDVFTSPVKQPKRTLLEFSNKLSSSNISNLVIRDESNNYTQEYINLTKDFYLNL